MRFLLRLLILLIVLGAIAGGVMLAGWEIAPPSRTVEKVIPNDRF